MNADKERMSAREWAERLVEEGLVEIGPSAGGLEITGTSIPEEESK